jgi:hypothetical protein
MREMHPVVKDTSTIQVTVFNNQVATDLKRMLPGMEKYMRERLLNDETKVEIKVAEAETAKRVYSKADRLRMMMEKNHAVAQLVNELDLKID